MRSAHSPFPCLAERLPHFLLGETVVTIKELRRALLGQTRVGASGPAYFVKQMLWTTVVPPVHRWPWRFCLAIVARSPWVKSPDALLKPSVLVAITASCSSELHKLIVHCISHSTPPPQGLADFCLACLFVFSSLHGYKEMSYYKFVCLGFRSL